MATVVQIQVRCAGCNRRLADLVNEIEAGQVFVELKCPRCGHPHLEVLRPQPSSSQSKPATVAHVRNAVGLIYSIASSLWTGLVCVIVLIAIVPTAPHAFGAGPEPLAEVNGEAITSEQVGDALGARLATLERQLYDLKRQKLEALIDERLLAQAAMKRGVTVPELLDAEVTAKAGTVSEEDVEKFYSANKSRLRGTEVELREQIRGRLQTQKVTERRRAFLGSLRSQVQIITRLPEPPAFHAVISTDGAPLRGPADAPVTIVEFSDFHCPYCKQVLPTLTQLLERYGDKVKLVFRDFPLDHLHPQARRAAEAARCAKDQNKFWEYHDILFANAPKASPDQLKAYAEQAGIDVATFQHCVSTGTHTAAVQRDVDEGLRVGVTGTPGFFINGRLLSGAQPLEGFARMIDEALKRTK